MGFSVLTLLVNPQDRAALRAWLGAESQDGRTTSYERLRNYCQANAISPFDAMGDVVAGNVNIPHITALRARFVALTQRLTLLQNVASLQGIVDNVFPANLPGCADVRVLALAAMTNAADTKELLDELSELIVQPEIPGSQGNSVRIMSLYKSKGLTAKVVIFAELVRDGRRGACIDASGSMQKFLDRQGVWSYLACGGVRIEYPHPSGIPDTYFWPLVHPDNPAKTGHAWLRVPPFMAIDMTLPVQEYSARIKPYFDGMVAAEEVSAYEPVAGDLYENELVELVVSKSGRPPTLDNLSAGQKQFMEIFPAFGTSYRQLRLKYIPMQINAIEGELADMRNLCLSGMYPLDLYEKFLKTRQS